MARIFLCICRWKILRSDFTECESEISKDNSGSFLLREYKSTGNPLITMLPGCRLKKVIQLFNTTIKPGGRGSASGELFPAQKFLSLLHGLF